MKYKSLREEVFETVVMCCASDLIRLSAGNISAHDGEGHVAITPSARRYDRMKLEDIPIIDLEGNWIEGRFPPSSEILMHTTIFRELPQVKGVVHTHSVYAIAFSSTDREIPVVSTEIKSIGGPVPTAQYATLYTEEAGHAAAALFESRPSLKCMMLRNHGLVAIGSTLYDAYQNAYKFEIGAEVYYRALQIGTPVPLTDKQIEEINQAYRQYRSRYS
jgi:L-ribulose-5-phosphate 4-epimerase